MNQLFAHVKWFQEPVERTLPGISVGEAALVLLFLLPALFIAAYLRKPLMRYEELASRLTAPYLKFSPLIVRLSAGFGLVLASSAGYFLAPNLDNPPEYILLAQAAVGIMWVLGLGTRVGSALFGLVFIVSLMHFPLMAALEHVVYLGAAAYLAIMGGGVYAADDFLERYRMPKPERRLRAIRLYMLAAGVTLVWLALSEKLLDIDLAQSFLNSHDWNILSGIGLSDRAFILGIGAIESLLGLMLILNLLPKIAVLLIAGAMAATAILLGPAEVPGHLYALGLAAAVWIHDTEAKESPPA